MTYETPGQPNNSPNGNTPPPELLPPAGPNFDPSTNPNTPQQPESFIPIQDAVADAQANGGSTNISFEKPAEVVSAATEAPAPVEAPVTRRRNTLGRKLITLGIVGSMAGGAVASGGGDTATRTPQQLGPEYVQTVADTKLNEADTQALTAQAETAIEIGEKIKASDEAGIGPAGQKADDAGFTYNEKHPQAQATSEANLYDQEEDTVYEGPAGVDRGPLSPGEPGVGPAGQERDGDGFTAVERGEAIAPALGPVAEIVVQAAEEAAQNIEDEANFQKLQEAAEHSDGSNVK